MLVTQGTPPCTNAFPSCSDTKKTCWRGQIQQQARFEQEETGNGSLSLAVSPASPSGRTNGGSGSEGAANSADTSAFRTRILKLDEATLQDHGVLPAEGGLLQANRKRRGKSSRRAGGETDSRGKQSGGRHEGPGRRGPASGSGNAENTAWKEIPLSWVVRGRQESHLVDQQVPTAFFCTAGCCYLSPNPLRESFWSNPPMISLFIPRLQYQNCPRWRSPTILMHTGYTHGWVRHGRPWGAEVSIDFQQLSTRWIHVISVCLFVFLRSYVDTAGETKNRLSDTSQAWARAPCLSGPSFQPPTTSPCASAATATASTA